MRKRKVSNPAPRTAAKRRASSKNHPDSDDHGSPDEEESDENLKIEVRYPPFNLL